MTPEQIIQRVRELDKMATPGPWGSHLSYDVIGYPHYPIHGMSGDQKRDSSVLEANAALIAEFRTLLPALADAYDAQARKLAEVEAERDALKAKVAQALDRLGRAPTSSWDDDAFDLAQAVGDIEAILKGDQ